MHKNDPTTLLSISNAQTLDEVAASWDIHSLADYESQTHEVEFNVRANQRRRVTLDPELHARIQAVAQKRGISSETLVNLWLIEHLESMNLA